VNNHPSDRPGHQEAVEATAAAWLARRDLGFTAEEETEFALWRFSDPQHTAAVARLAAAWGSLDQLRDFRPEAIAHPDQDLLAPTLDRKVIRFPVLAGALALAAAAAVALGLFNTWTRLSHPAEAPARRLAIIHPGAERVTLDDGSVVELNTGAKIDVQFTTAERRVRLLSGEAHFTVAKNPARPFFVDTGKVSVRAVGTAFSVALGTQQVSVLVTEGKVQVIEQGAGSGEPGATGSAPSAGPPAPGDPVFLTTGQRAVVRLMPLIPLVPATKRPSAVQVNEMTPAEVDRALSWQAMRLEFVDMPLGDVVAEFNRYNWQKITVNENETVLRKTR
jgi:transmembrane sensor